MSEAELQALEAEAAAEPTAFEFGGRSFNPVEKLDLRVIVALQRNDFDRALVLILGRKQADELLALETDDVLDEVAIRRLAEVWAQVTGATSLGESEASTSS